MKKLSFIPDHTDNSSRSRIWADRYWAKSVHCATFRATACNYILIIDRSHHCLCWHFISAVLCFKTPLFKLCTFQYIKIPTPTWSSNFYHVINETFSLDWLLFAMLMVKTSITKKSRLTNVRESRHALFKIFFLYFSLPRKPLSSLPQDMSKS